MKIWGSRPVDRGMKTYRLTLAYLLLLGLGLAAFGCSSAEFVSIPNPINNDADAETVQDDASTEVTAEADSADVDASEADAVDDSDSTPPFDSSDPLDSGPIDSGTVAIDSSPPADSGSVDSGPKDSGMDAGDGADAACWYDGYPFVVPSHPAPPGSCTSCCGKKCTLEYYFGGKVYYKCCAATSGCVGT